MLKYTYILSSVYYLLAKSMEYTAKKSWCTDPVPATHIPSPIEYEKEVDHLLSDGGPHELTQSNITLAKLKTQDFHNREGSIVISNGLHTKSSTHFVGPAPVAVRAS